jgi:PAS domain-containing protein
MDTKKSQRKPIGTTNANILIPEALHEAMKRIRQARHDSEGADVKLCRIYREAVEQYVERFDPETGLPARHQGPSSSYMDTRMRGPSPSRHQWPGHNPPGPLTYALGRFHGTKFADDAALCRAMDSSFLMLWATGASDEHLYANALLVTYTGRSAPDFLRSGWTEVIHPEDRAQTVLTSLDGFKTRQPFHLTYRMLRRDGNYGTIVDQAQPHFRLDGTFAGYVGTLYEVTGPAIAYEFDGTVYVEIGRAA